MTEAAPQTTTQILEKIRPAEIAEITDTAIANHLRHTYVDSEVEGLFIYRLDRRPLFD